MKESLSTTLRSAFLEALFVVFGVTLALAANEWRQNVNAQELADAALESIVVELEANLELVQSSLVYHESKVQMLQKNLGAGDTPLPKDFERGFINPAWVTDTAWEVAKETGVLADIDYETVLTLSATYERFQRYNKQSDMAGQLVYAKIFTEGPQGITEQPGNLMSIVYTFIYREHELAASLAATLAMLEP